MVKSLLSSSEEVHLQGFGPVHKLVEDTTRVISGIHRLVAALEEVAAIDKIEASRTRAVRDIHEQIKGELSRVWVAHNEEVVGLRTAIDGFYQQLEEAMSKINRSWVVAQALESQAEILGDRLKASKARVNEAVAGLVAWSSSGEMWKAFFLKSKEFKQVVKDRAYPLFQTDRKDFLELDKAIV